MAYLNSVHVGFSEETVFFRWLLLSRGVRAPKIATLGEELKLAKCELASCSSAGIILVKLEVASVLQNLFL